MNKKDSTSRAKREFFNKKARFDYRIDESVEAGVVLTGREIKVIRAGRLDMSGSYAKIINGELYWLGGNFNIEGGENQRSKKLLLHKEQIQRLSGKVQEGGATLIPLKLYFKKGKAKIELGLGYGLKKHDKREVLKRREQEIEARRQIGKLITNG